MNVQNTGYLPKGEFGDIGAAARSYRCVEDNLKAEDHITLAGIEDRRPEVAENLLRQILYAFNESEFTLRSDVMDLLRRSGLG